MKRIFLTLLAATCLQGATANADIKQITAEEIRSRLAVKGEILVFSEDGKRLDKAFDHWNRWKGSQDAPLESNWGNNGDYGKVYIHTVWTVLQSGKIQVLIEEFEKQEEDPKSSPSSKFSGLLKKSEFILENFAQVNWRVLNIKDKYVIARLTPELEQVDETVDVSGIPISGENISLSDNKGFLWNEGATFSGNFVGLTTHRGTIVFSFKPFKGATLAGRAVNNEINFKFADDLKVKLRSSTAFLPTKISAKVYAIFKPDQKQVGCIRCTHTFSSSTEESILNRLTK